MANEKHPGYKGKINGMAKAEDALTHYENALIWDAFTEYIRAQPAGTAFTSYELSQTLAGKIMLREPRVIGPIMVKLGKCGLIKPTDRIRTHASASRHMGTSRVWEVL